MRNAYKTSELGIDARMSGVDDPFDLQRFVTAQNPVYEEVCAELRNGRKRGHWMWFIFPQLRGLGHSQMAAAFGIASRDQAEAYLSHPVLGARLRECTQLVTLVEERSISQILGYPDDLKFRSSMTLFAAVASGDWVFPSGNQFFPSGNQVFPPGNQVFNDALEKYFGGERDPLTLARIC
jgi:uncharacterized protein (DUF1810 family)